LLHTDYDPEVIRHTENDLDSPVVNSLKKVVLPDEYNQITTKPIVKRNPIVISDEITFIHDLSKRPLSLEEVDQHILAMRKQMKEQGEMSDETYKHALLRKMEGVDLMAIHHDQNNEITNAKISALLHECVSNTQNLLDTAK
jgi:hypothetical protein